MSQPIKLTRAALYYKALPHQKQAFEYLQSRLSEQTLNKFASMYRSGNAKLTWAHPITGKIVQRCQSLGFDLQLGVAYVVGIEGVNLDLTPNADELDAWNDVAGILYVQRSGKCLFVGPFKATTEPGRYYTINPMNSQGGARVLTDSFNKDIWIHGTHIRQPNCLIQHGAKITVTRDQNRDGKRGANELKQTAFLGINFHHANDSYSLSSIGRWSAGCLVIPSKAEHQRCINYLKSVVPNQKKFSYILLDGSRL